MIRRPPRSTQSRSSAASDVYKRQTLVVSLPAGRDSLWPVPRFRFVRSSCDVKLLDQIPGSGDVLFRWRGPLPLLMPPLFLLGLLDARLPATLSPAVQAWQFVSLAIALSLSLIHICRCRRS